MKTIEELENLIRHLIERVNRLEAEVANQRTRPDTMVLSVEHAIFALDRAAAEITARRNGGGK